MIARHGLGRSSTSSPSAGSQHNARSSMAPCSSSHQNAAKKIKALLRRTHFPVARLRQLPVTTGGLAPAAAGGGGNPWDGIVSGDPRAALVVLHWTLLDMSPLFASMLLDRDYAGLNSMTDFKFVATTLRMLRDEFDFRPQLTAEQFLTSGFAEVKMRLLAEIVELVMRSHHSIAQQKQEAGGDGGSSSSNNNNNGSVANNYSSNANNTANSSTSSSSFPSPGSGWAAKSDHSGGGSGGGSGASSPWQTPNPTPPQPQQFRLQVPQPQQQQQQQQQQHSRPGSVDSRSSAGGFSAASPPVQPRSPPLLCGGPIGVMAGYGGNGGGGHAIRHHHHRSVLSPSAMSDEQNAPPLPPPLIGSGMSGGVMSVAGVTAGGGMSSHRRGVGVTLRAPVSVRPPVSLHQEWQGSNSNSNPRAFYPTGDGSDGSGGYVAGVDGGGPAVGGGSTLWVQGHGRGGSHNCGNKNDLGGSRGGPGVAPRPTGGRSPLGPRSAQAPRYDQLQQQQQQQQQQHVSGVDLGEPVHVTRDCGMLPPPVRVGLSPGGSGSGSSGGSGGGGGSDWLAVQQAFGSPASALHMPPAVVVPTSPPKAHPSAAGRAAAGSPLPNLPPRSVPASSVSAGGAGGTPGREESGSGAIAPVGSGRDVGGRMNQQQQPQLSGSGGAGDHGGRMRCDDGDDGRQQEQQQRQQEQQEDTRSDVIKSNAGTGGGGGDPADDGSLAEELGKMQQQIEAMLERHSKTLEGRMGETEQMISARLALLETKVHGLEISSPVHT